MPRRQELQYNKERKLLAAFGRRGAPVMAYAFIVLLHMLGWGTLIFLVAPMHLTVASKAFGLGVGLTAYTLGMRHAFDADHIAAIDNTTRKLAGDGKPSTTVGFWFSAGHSSIVFVLTLLIALGVHSIARHVSNRESAFHTLAGIVGPSVSGAFLLVIAVFNCAALIDVVKIFRGLRTAQAQDSVLDALLLQRGFVTRLIGPIMRIIRTPAHMYAVGLLFGLGFDTATEVALLVLTGSGVASGVPWYATLCLPVLFASGMLLFDTLDGSLMSVAYRWALDQPVRKLYYNIVVTTLSILVAVLIGTVEILGLVSTSANNREGLLSHIAALDLNQLGFCVVGLFAVTWIFSVSIWKIARIEEKWAPTLGD
jgi:nickel/cobalt transporter (NiCoT) family protein